VCGENTNNRLFLDTRRKQVAATETFRLAADQLIESGDAITGIALGCERSLLVTSAGELWTTAGEERTPVRIELGKGAKVKTSTQISVVGVADTLDLAATAEGTGK
jgi:hypothetical protein